MTRARRGALRATCGALRRLAYNPHGAAALRGVFADPLTGRREMTAGPKRAGTEPRPGRVAAAAAPGIRSCVPETKGAEGRRRDMRRGDCRRSLMSDAAGRAFARAGGLFSGRRLIL